MLHAICSGGFTQVSELWPVGLLFFLDICPGLEFQNYIIVF